MSNKTKSDPKITASKAEGLIRSNFIVAQPAADQEVRINRADESIAAIRADERAKVLAEQAALWEKVKPLLKGIASYSTPQELEKEREENPLIIDINLGCWCGDEINAAREVLSSMATLRGEGEQE